MRRRGARHRAAEAVRYHAAGDRRPELSMGTAPAVALREHPVRGAGRAARLQYSRFRLPRG
ncbi:hypothetical protein GCM10018793_01330 [Streptomyces sulfonofaciens]|uniref:Uncharacterized protein n=1 Tax=Streptomyces sulfonofaciens TaxID=68272 RepID=A0A919FMQ2_9ACTN|nr:hypothetical protein GCM10018793_01330 [Streptomyces sulfonofaciens]